VRVAFFALLLLNLLFFGWAEWIDEPAPTPNPIAGLPRLELASEMPKAQLSASAGSTLALGASAAEAPKCVSIGPFEDVAGARKAVKMLRARRLAPQQRTVQAVVRRYWVYLGGFKRQDQVTRTLQRLELKGVDNAEAMPEEQGVRRISLGVFSSRARAQLRAGALRSMGFAPKVKSRDLPGTIYWLDITVNGGAAAVPLQGLEPVTGDSQIAVRACPASGSSADPSAPGSAPSSTPASIPGSHALTPSGTPQQTSPPPSEPQVP
jgi:hypothetical protein